MIRCRDPKFPNAVQHQSQWHSGDGHQNGDGADSAANTEIIQNIYSKGY